MNPRLLIRAVRLQANTRNGPVGSTVRFERGLNVLRADNSSGKSTMLQAIVYALGLEGMLSAQRNIPLPHAMTDSVSVDSVDVPVVQSFVQVEIENGDGRVVTVRRAVKDAVRDTGLIEVREGALGDRDEDASGRDYFVRRPGAAQREAGFHHFLADFVGWQLPNVPRFEGSEGPLYMETLFPYFYVEQKHGWSGVQARIPTYLGIRDVGKRSAEFILGLEVFQRIVLRQRISSNIGELEASWLVAQKELGDVVRVAGASLTRAPRRIADSLDAESVTVAVHVNGQWLPLADALSRLREELGERTRRGVPSVEAVAPELEGELERSESAIRAELVTLSVILEESAELSRRGHQLDTRIAALQEDLQRHKDASLLSRLGSAYAHELLDERLCPTCHQDVSDGLDVVAHAMTVEESIAFIERQKSTFAASADDVQRSLDALRIREASVRASISETRRRVRALKESLMDRESAPSLADLSERVALEARVASLEANASEIDARRIMLRELAEQCDAQRARLGSLGNAGLTPDDSTKVDLLERYVREQLVRYGFSSLPVSGVEISRETYRPVHEGFDLGFDLSASDMIRVIWSYLLGLLRVSDECGGAHPGLLIFDEPRQQETAHESYRQLLHEAVERGARGAQVILATSEDAATLRDMLGDSECNLIDVPSGTKLLRPVS